MIRDLGWAQYHRPRHIVAALSSEVGELLDRTLFRSPDDIDALFTSDSMAVREEMADVLINVLSIVDYSGADINALVIAKTQELIDRHQATPYGAAKSEAQACSACGHVVEPDWSYCAKCGSLAPGKGGSDPDLTGWDVVAKLDMSKSRTRWAHDYVLHPAILEAIPHQTGSLLDFGAGRGELLHFLASRIEVDLVGLDPSPGMREVALQHGWPLVDDTTRLKGRHFDCVVSNMTLSAIRDVAKALTDLRGLLVGGGIAILTIPHPCFALLRTLHTTTKREVASQEYVGASIPVELDWLSRYRFGSSENLTWDGLAATTALHNRSLTQWIRLLEGAGLSLVSIEEPYPVGGESEDPRLHSLYSLIPAFLLLRVKRSD